LIWWVWSPSWVAGATCLAATVTTLLQVRALNLTRTLARPVNVNDAHTLADRRVRFRYAWTMPIGSALYGAIVVASMWHAYTRGNVWKGRSYKTVASSS
jgi:hypothetical protein